VAERRHARASARIAAPCLRRRVGAPPPVGTPVASPHVGVGASVYVKASGGAEVGGDRPSWNTPPTLLRARGGRGMSPSLSWHLPNHVTRHLPAYQSAYQATHVTGPRLYTTERCAGKTKSARMRWHVSAGTYVIGLIIE
jgi:hypothetical protein